MTSQPGTALSCRCGKETPSRSSPKKVTAAGGEERCTAGWVIYKHPYLKKKEKKERQKLTSTCSCVSRWGSFQPTMWRRITLTTVNLAAGETCRLSLNVCRYRWDTWFPSFALTHVHECGCVRVEEKLTVDFLVDCLVMWIKLMFSWLYQCLVSVQITYKTNTTWPKVCGHLNITTICDFLGTCHLSWCSSSSQMCWWGLGQVFDP